MFGTGELFMLFAIMLVMVFAGVHVAVALGAGSVIGIYMMHGDITVVRTFIAGTAYEALRDYVFAVIPLFMLMGEFLAKCGAARDLFALINRLMRVVPGRLAIATVLANAVFAFVTGVSIAAAAAPMPSATATCTPANTITSMITSSPIISPVPNMRSS